MKLPSLKEAIGFTIILIVILSTFQILVKKGVTFSDSEQTGKVNRIFKHEINSEVVVFGPSVAEAGVDANALSKGLKKSVFNAAIVGTAFPQYKCLAEELADYSRNTKYVVFAVTYFDFMKMMQLHEPSRFYAHLDNNYVHDAFKAIDNDRIMRMDFVPFYSITQYSHSFYKNAFIGWRNYFSGSTTVDTLNGFVPNKNKYTGTLLPSDSAKVTLELDTAQRRSFLKLKEKLRKHDIKVIVVFMPMLRSGQDHFTNINDVAKTIETWTDPGCFINYLPSSYCDNKENFYNNNHLNANGARVISGDIARQLVERGLIH